MSLPNYIQFDFETTGREQTELLIAMLAEQGFEGFEESEDYLSAFIPENEYREDRIAAISTLFQHFSYTRSVIEHINWNKQWESSFKPVKVNEFAAIRAAFHEPVTTVTHEIIITPKMSFGTGHHATTFLMVEQMSKLDLANKTVLDFGTGTGVLAILAEKMGATGIIAIDNDTWSIENIRENIGANGCTRIDVQMGDSIPQDKKFDIILANINLNVILANLPGISRASKDGTIILLSGFLDGDKNSLLPVIMENHFTVSEVFRKGEWICVRAVKN